jgi:hypothetical protein
MFTLKYAPLKIIMLALNHVEFLFFAIFSPLALAGRPADRTFKGSRAGARARQMGRLHLTKSETRFNTDKTITCFFVVRPV